MSVFATGMTSGPYGIEILGNTLFCCYGGGKVRGYDLTTGTQVFDKNLGGTFLNGITSDGDKNLFITDFSGKKIYRLNVQTQTSNVMVSGLVKSPNGIIYEGSNNRCVFVNWGTAAPIMSMSTVDSSVTTLANTSFANMDGIAKDGLGNYFVSVWGNSSIQKFNSSMQAPATVASSLSSPADIYYNTITDTLAVPNSGTANNVVFFGFGGPSGDISNTPAKSSIRYEAFTQQLLITTTKELTITLFSSTGQLLHSLTIQRPMTLDLSSLSNGMYFFNVEREGSLDTGKFIKQ